MDLLADRLMLADRLEKLEDLLLVLKRAQLQIVMSSINEQERNSIVVRMSQQPNRQGKIKKLYLSGGIGSGSAIQTPLQLCRLLVHDRRAFFAAPKPSRLFLQTFILVWSYHISLPVLVFRGKMIAVDQAGQKDCKSKAQSSLKIAGRHHQIL